MKKMLNSLLYEAKLREESARLKAQHWNANSSSNTVSIHTYNYCLVCIHIAEINNYFRKGIVNWSQISSKISSNHIFSLISSFCQGLRICKLSIMSSVFGNYNRIET